MVWKSHPAAGPGRYLIHLKNLVPGSALCDNTDISAFSNHACPTRSEQVFASWHDSDDEDAKHEKKNKNKKKKKKKKKKEEKDQKDQKLLRALTMGFVGGLACR